ncbi:hypothetical protein T4D_8296 [Trichinella pseudospiralis]|uniref:Uncharacterized protein n=1 Tax=Trichinella pseudospiralis TaxID=6337 RepID=A0A0V1G4D5_TRIPS|nr:hypothetical protein T4D_8296 [Trichinella pseudospiralis]
MLKAGSHVLTIDNCQKAMDLLGRPVVFYDKLSNQAEAETEHNTSGKGQHDSELVSLLSLALEPVLNSKSLGHYQNHRCRRLIDSDGNYLKFTVLTNDFIFNNMLFWKLLVKVRCDMVKLHNREPEKSVVVSFVRFLRICDFVNDFLSKPVVKGEHGKVGSSVNKNDVETCCLCLDNIEDIVLRTECSSGKCPLCLDKCSSKACQWYVMTDIPSNFSTAGNFVQNSSKEKLNLRQALSKSASDSTFEQQRMTRLIEAKEFG